MLGTTLSVLAFMVAVPGGYLEPSSAPGSYSVTVAVSLGGSGTGRVTSSPAGIDCPGDCTETYSSNDTVTVTLTATATGGSAFTGWGGECTGTGSCVIPFTAPATKSVSAEFTAPPGPTGQRAAVIKHCKKKFPKGHKRARCIKKAKRLPV